MSRWANRPWSVQPAPRSCKSREPSHWTDFFAACGPPAESMAAQLAHISAQDDPRIQRPRSSGVIRAGSTIFTARFWAAKLSGPARHRRQCAGSAHWGSRSSHRTSALARRGECKFCASARRQPSQARACTRSTTSAAAGSRRTFSSQLWARVPGNVAFSTASGARGLHYKEMGNEVGITVTTVRTHLHTIYGKLHVQPRTEAVVRYLSRR